jgi:hypothetical protein
VAENDAEFLKKRSLRGLQEAITRSTTRLIVLKELHRRFEEAAFHCSICEVGAQK